MNKQEESDMNKFVEKFKKDFSGSDDYLSGINEAAYSMYRMLKLTRYLEKDLVDLLEIKVSTPKPIFIIEIPSSVAKEVISGIHMSKSTKKLKKDYHVLVFSTDKDHPKFTVMGEGEFSSSSLSKRVDEVFNSEKKKDIKEYLCLEPETECQHLTFNDTCNLVDNCDLKREKA